MCTYYLPEHDAVMDICSETVIKSQHENVNPSFPKVKYGQCTLIWHPHVLNLNAAVLLLFFFKKKSAVRTHIHENRKSNVDAHTLARSLISFDTGRHVWVLNPPSGIRNSYDQLHE